MTDRPIRAHPASPESVGTTENAHTDTDPGSFVGNRPERQAETIPGGVRPDDERVAANSSQATSEPSGSGPEGHREPDADRGEAGEDR
jgi:hypothetical protein